MGIDIDYITRLSRSTGFLAKIHRNVYIGAIVFTQSFKIACDSLVVTPTLTLTVSLSVSKTVFNIGPKRVGL